MSDKIDYPEDRKDLDRQIERGPQDDVILCGGVGEDAVHAENVEHEMSFWQALKVYPKAMSWSMVMSFCIVSVHRLGIFSPVDSLLTVVGF